MALPVARTEGFGAAKTFPVRLRPAEAWDPARSRLVVEDQEAAVPPFVMAEGEVAGLPNSEVRLTWTDSWARGVVLVNETLHFVFLGPAPGHGPPSLYHVPLSLPVPAGAAEAGPPKEPTQPAGCLTPVPPALAPTMPRTRFSGPWRILRVVVDGDPPFAEKHGPDAAPLLAAYANDLDAILEYQVGLRVDVAALHLHTDPARFDPARVPLETLAAYWNARPGLDRDAVHLVSGRAAAGAQAYCIGAAGEPDRAYSFHPDWYADRDANAALITLAHELGHVLAAHHHYGNPAEGEGATIMLHSYAPGNRPIYGTLERSVIRGWAEAHLDAAAGPATVI